MATTTTSRSRANNIEKQQLRSSSRSSRDSKSLERASDEVERDQQVKSSSRDKTNVSSSSSSTTAVQSKRHAQTRQGQGSSSSRGTRMTRVRINSTSEQIEDPNWIVQWNQLNLSEQQQEENEFGGQQRKRMNHLKIIHRKLKSTLSGNNGNGTSPFSPLNLLSIVSSNNSNNNNNNNNNSSSSSSQQNDSLDNSNNNDNGTTSLAPPPSPIFPTGGQVKVPVSILKQRTTSTNTTNNASQQRQQHATISQTNSKRLNVSSEAGPSSLKQNRARSVKLARRVPPASPTPSINLPPTDHSNLQAQSSNASTLSQRAHPKSSISSQHQHQHQGQQTTNDDGPGSNGSSKHQGGEVKKQTGTAHVPICADGQVKVSGWKRKNLLAKTLSHFDEIRGNQRPVFVPTKIKLSASVGVESSTDKATRFADIVREAISKKNLLAQQQTQSQDDSFRAQSATLMPHSPDSEEPFRSASAAATLERSTGRQQHRSSFGGLSSGQSQQQSQQQVQIHPRKEGSTSPTVITTSPQINNQSCNVMSARQLKLDQKNNQLLQSLRRQSNNEPLTLDHLNSYHTSPSKSQAKNWKRLTQKLTLLTNPNVRSKQHNQAGSNSNSFMRSLEKRASDVGDQTTRISDMKRASVNSNSSNSYQGSHGHQHQVQYHHNYEQRSSTSSSTIRRRDLLSPGDEHQNSRKLSSSSMQNPPRGCCHLSVSAQTSPSELSNYIGRRSSDSDAYRKHQSGKRAVGQADQSTDISTPANKFEAQATLLTVKQNDLIQLLHVTGSKEDEDKRVNVGLQLTGNKQTTSPTNITSQDQSPLRILQTQTKIGYESQYEMKSAKPKQTADQWLSAQLTRLRAAETQRENVCPSSASRSSSLDELTEGRRGCGFNGNGEQLETSGEDESGEICGPTSRAKIGSWMVRKSSKMASLQQRLRNIRNWPTSKSKQRNSTSSALNGSTSPAEIGFSESSEVQTTTPNTKVNPNSSSGPWQQQRHSSSSSLSIGRANNNTDSENEVKEKIENRMEANDDSKICREQQQEQEQEQEQQQQQPLMDPTLIGDAIELFLRAMQSQGSNTTITTTETMPSDSCRARKSVDVLKGESSLGSSDQPIGSSLQMAPSEHDGSLARENKLKSDSESTSKDELNLEPTTSPAEASIASASA